MKNRIAIIGTVVTVLFTMLACNFPTYTQNQTQNKSLLSRLLLATPDPNATGTPTAFQPEEVTPTFTPTGAPVPTPPSEYYFDGGAKRIPQSPGQINILVLGSDFRPGGGFRTDVMVFVAINRITGKVSLISFPRDLYVVLPGKGNQRLNTSQEFGGFDLTQKTFEYNFGIHPDHYIMTNFDGFKNIINALGGVDINAAKGLSDHCDLADVPGHYCTIQPGRNHFNGEMALWYVRSRYSTSDFDRLRRAQEVVKGVFVKLVSLDSIARAPILFAQFKTSVETDMSLETITSLIPIMARLNEPGLLKQFMLDSESKSVTPWIEPGSGAYLLIPNPDVIQQKLLEAFSF